MSKKSKLESVMQGMNKKYGQGAVMTLGDQPLIGPVMSTGVLALDSATGIGGFPKGRIVEIYGPESAGKTLISLQAIASEQRKGNKCAFIDVEHALNVDFARRIGVNIDELIFAQPSSGEEAFDIAQGLIETGELSLIVIDSVAALTPQAELDGSIEDQQVGLQARLVSKGIRKVNGYLSNTQTTLIMINQLRSNIQTGFSYGPNESTPGGRALKFWASMRIDVRRIKQIKHRNVPIGNEVKVKVVKNKMAAPFGEAIFELMFDSGASNEGTVIDYGIEHGIIKRAGAWFSYIDDEGNEISLGQGREAVRETLRDDEELYQYLYDKIIESIVPSDEEIEEQLEDIDGEDLDYI